MTIQEYILDQMNGITDIATFLCVIQLVASDIFKKTDSAEMVLAFYDEIDGGCTECLAFDNCVLCQINE